MTYRNFTLATDADGIALITWDMPGRSMNVIDQTTMDEIEALTSEIASNDAIHGVILASGKEAFSGGADLSMLETLLAAAAEAEKEAGPEAGIERLFDQGIRLGRLFRIWEKVPKPKVAAINGTCVGGAFEWSLACNARIVVDDAKAKLGLPEVRVGLMPGAGGSVRVGRLANPQEALQMLLRGEQLSPERALKMKLVDKVVPRGELIDAAKAWLKESPRTVQPWDEKDYKLPGGKVHSPAGYNLFPAATALYRRETHDNYPGQRNTLKAFVEGLQVPFDTALQIEGRYFINVTRTRESGAMIRSLFLSMQELNKGARRPAAVPVATIRKLGIVGAGFMGAGIAEVAARAGIDVVLLDRDDEAAANGRATVEAAYAKQVSRGRMKVADADAALARISTGADFATLGDADLVIEAVFEDRGVKDDVLRRISAAIGKDTILASNTSTLPITSLAGSTGRPKDFIGIHFFSPVARMMLVEVILGKKTGDVALARALDFIRAIRKTPIVVNDSRGFYTSRVVETYIGEGHRMLIEGVPAAMIENAGKMAGMPVGPLSLNDEVALDLSLKIMNATRADLGDDAVPAAPYALISEMVEKRGRFGRKNRKGFYDYPDNPRDRKRLWPGLTELYSPVADPDALAFAELKTRLLVIQALETARCFAEGVLTDVREADVGSILGFGFAPFSGGTLSYIDLMGAAPFVKLCDRLAKTHGPRFKPNRLLREMARNGETFYGRFPPPAARKAA